MQRLFYHMRAMRRRQEVRKDAVFKYGKATMIQTKYRIYHFRRYDHDPIVSIAMFLASIVSIAPAGLRVLHLLFASITPAALHLSLLLCCIYHSCICHHYFRN